MMLFSPDLALILDGDLAAIGSELSAQVA